MEKNQKPASRTTLKIIYAAMLGAPVFYAFVGKIISTAAEKTPLPMPITAVLALMAVGSVTMAYILPRAKWTAAAQRGRPEQEALEDYQSAMVIHWACFESVSVFGFVLGVISGQWLAVVVGAAVSLAFLATARPAPDDMIGKG